LFANDRVGLPVTDTAAFVDCFWAFINRNAPFDLTTTIWGAVTLFTLFLTAQVLIEITAISLVMKNVLINSLWTDVEAFFLSQSVIDLFWASILAE
jgi:hypothetical protein